MGKLTGSYPLPYQFNVSGVLRILPGNPLAANYTVTSAIAGVPLTGGGSLTVNLVEPGTLYGAYQNQLDLRVMKTFRFGHVRTQGLLDFYNVTNASAVRWGVAERIVWAWIITIPSSAFVSALVWWATRSYLVVGN